MKSFKLAPGIGKLESYIHAVFPLSIADGNKVIQTCEARMMWILSELCFHIGRAKGNHKTNHCTNKPSSTLSHAIHFTWRQLIHAFSALTLLVGQKEAQSACKKLSRGILAWLCVKVQICIWLIWCHCHSLSLAIVNSDWFYVSGVSSPRT